MVGVQKVTVKLVLDPELAFEGPGFEALVAAVAARVADQLAAESPAPEPTDEKARFREIARTKASETAP